MTGTVDTRALREHWARVGLDRLAVGGAGGVFSYNVVSVSRADLARIEELHPTTPASLGGPVAMARVVVRDGPDPRWRWLKVMGMALAPGSLMLACYNLLPLAWSDGFGAAAEVLRRLTGRRLPHWPFVFATVGSVGLLLAFVFVMDILLWFRSAGG